MSDLRESPYILGTAGHIDHGKTSLVRALTGIDTDRLPQEKQRGITIDIGFAVLELPPYRLGVVDVPGHERFIKNMLAGASGIDVVLLVVAADDSVMPQTREHLTLCDLLGIRHGVIAITKCDLADAAQRKRVRADVASLTAGTFLENAPVIETSTSPPVGLDALRETLTYACSQVERPADHDIFRMAVDRSFHQTGHGTVVTGTIASGILNVEDRVELLPQIAPLRVRNLHRHGKAVTSVQTGQRAAINLASISHHDIERGCELATPGYLRPCSHLLAKVHMLDESPFGLKNRGRVRLHLGTQARVSTIHFFDRTTLEPGESAWVQIISSEPVVASGQQPIVLRSESPMHTLGGGHVWWLLDQRMRKSMWEHCKPIVEQLQADDPYTRLCAAVALYKHKPWRPLDVCRDAKLSQKQADALIKQALDQGEILQVDVRGNQPRLVHRDYWKAQTTQSVTTIRKLHEAAENRSSLDRARVIAKLADAMDTDLAGAMVEHLQRQGELTGDGQHVALKEFQANLTAKQQQVLEQVITATEQVGLSFLDEKQLSKRVPCSSRDLEAVLSYASQGGLVVHLGQGQYLDHATFDVVLEKIKAALAERETMTMAEIRDLLETTRRYALPICEYLDELGYTERDQNVRRWVGTVE